MVEDELDIRCRVFEELTVALDRARLTIHEIAQITEAIGKLNDDESFSLIIRSNASGQTTSITIDY